ncbi:MAG: Ger(x)C family spore germination protein [Eubacterium sp.]|nr:Ger(x)C family spore germination protein [Eubacterium sp.]
MKNIFKIIVCVMAVSLTFSSCTKTSKRINDLTIVQALAVDGNENNAEVSLQYLNLFAGSSASDQLSGNITSLTKGKGSNISEAVFNTSKTVSNDVFFGQNKLIVFGFDWSKNNVSSGIDYLLKSKDSRPDVLAVIGYPSAEEIVRSKEKSAQIPAENIYSLIKLGEENGHAAAVTVADILNLYNDETSDIFFPVLKAEKDNVKCIGTAVFSGDKYAAFLGEEETFAFLTVKNRFKRGIITFDVPNIGKVSVEVTSSRAKKSIEIKNSKIIFRIKIKTRLIINEAGKTVKKPLKEEDNILIQTACEKKLESICNSTVKKCFNNRSDPFMCARYLYYEDIGLYNKLKDNWQNYLNNIEVKSEVSSSLQRVSNNTAT